MKALFIYCLALVGVAQGQPQQTFYFGGQPSAQQTQNHHQVEEVEPDSREVLGNFFNGNVPTYTTSNPGPQYSQQQQGNPYRGFSSAPVQQQHHYSPVLNSNYISPPAPRPRQTHFFGNNYEFFRQFHVDSPSHQPSFRVQPFGGVGVTSSFPNNNVGLDTSRSVAPTASPSFSSTQYFTSPQPPPQAQTHRPVTLFPVPHSSPNSLGNGGFDEAAKSLGIRVVSTQNLKSGPVLEIQVVNSTGSSSRVTSTAPSTTPVSSAEGSTTPLSVPIEESTTPSSPTNTSPALAPSPTIVETEGDPTTRVIYQPVIVHNTGRTVATPVVRSRVISTSIGPTSTSTTPRKPYVFPTIDITTPNPPTTTSSVVLPKRGRNPNNNQGRGQSQGHSSTRSRGPLYNGNNLVPGQLYSQTNGAYNAYYETPHGQIVGLEEIEPKFVELNIPLHKMIPVLGEDVADLQSGRAKGPERGRRPQEYHRQTTFTSSNPFFETTRPATPFAPSPTHPSFFSSPAVVEPSPQTPPVIIVTEAGVNVNPSPSPTAVGTIVENGQVYKVGPKGRLLKKRRKVRPKAQKQLLAQLQPQPSPAASYETRVRPTTFRPPSTQEVEDNRGVAEEQPSVSVTTFRSRFRYSTTTSAPPPAQEERGQDSGGNGNQATLIQSRLKSLERQIRFKNRNKSS